MEPRSNLVQLRFLHQTGVDGSRKTHRQITHKGAPAAEKICTEVSADKHTHSLLERAAFVDLFLMSPNTLRRVLELLSLLCQVTSFPFLSLFANVQQSLLYVFYPFRGLFFCD